MYPLVHPGHVHLFHIACTIYEIAKGASSHPRHQRSQRSAQLSVSCIIIWLRIVEAAATEWCSRGCDEIFNTLLLCIYFHLDLFWNETSSWVFRWYVCVSLVVALLYSLLSLSLSCEQSSINSAYKRFLGHIQIYRRWYSNQVATCSNPISIVLCSGCVVLCNNRKYTWKVLGNQILISSLISI